MPSARPLVLLIVNKWWECNAVITALLSQDIQKRADLGWPALCPAPHRRMCPSSEQPPGAVTPRLGYALEHVDVEVWCVSDLLEHLPDRSSYQSSTSRKAARLPALYDGREAALVVACGTGAWPQNGVRNGSVTIGTKIFVHDRPDPNPDSNWSCDHFGEIVSSPLPQAAFDHLVPGVHAAVEAVSCFLPTPLCPDSQPCLYPQYDHVALGTVNVTNYGEYERIDPLTLAGFKGLNSGLEAVSLETTHGLLRLQREWPFMFVTGIANTIGCFGSQVDPRSVSQNFCAAYNVGVTLSWLLPRMDQALAPVLAVPVGRLADALRRYEGEVEAARVAGHLAPNTAHTYLLHARNFVRWVDGDFVPGSRSSSGGTRHDRPGCDAREDH